MKLRIHPAPAVELDAAAAWYEAQEPGLGAAFLDARGARRRATAPLPIRSPASRAAA